MSPKLQVKLLRVLQEHEFERVGESRTIRVDTRVIAATNQSLEEEIDAGHFREDLYYRLNVVPIHLPPLRDRREDIPVLVGHFLGRYSEENTVGTRPSCRTACSTSCTLHDWPGNVRELENCMERAVVLCEGEELTPELVAPPGKGRRQSPPDGGTCATTSTASSRTWWRSGIETVPDGTLDKHIVGGVERELIEQVLQQCDNVQVKAATRLGINRNTLGKKLQEGHRSRAGCDRGPTRQRGVARAAGETLAGQSAVGSELPKHLRVKRRKHPNEDQSCLLRRFPGSSCCSADRRDRPRRRRCPVGDAADGIACRLNIRPDFCTGEPIEMIVELKNVSDKDRLIPQIFDFRDDKRHTAHRHRARRGGGEARLAGRLRTGRRQRADSNQGRRGQADRVRQRPRAVRRPAGQARQVFNRVHVRRRQAGSAGGAAAGDQGAARRRVGRPGREQAGGVRESGRLPKRT